METLDQVILAAKIQFKLVAMHNGEPICVKCSHEKKKRIVIVETRDKNKFNCPYCSKVLPYEA